MHPITVLLPDGTTMTSNGTGELPLPHLPPSAARCHLFPSLHQGSGSLLSIGQLCDHGCTATFTATDLTVTTDTHHILTGYRGGPHGHWLVDLQTDPNIISTDPNQSATMIPALATNVLPATVNHVPTHGAAMAICPAATTDPNIGATLMPSLTANMLPAYTPTTSTDGAAMAIRPVSDLIKDRVAFYHAAMFSPVMSTWCTAIDAGHLSTWPDLTSAQVRRHFPHSVPMFLGHMDQTRSNVQSTKPKRRLIPHFITGPHSCPLC
jgi:hypothetical protein